MLGKAPGDECQKFASLRLFYGYQYGHPGKKLHFMGVEFGQRSEWNHDAELDWRALDEPLHAGLSRWVRDLNQLYRATAPLLSSDSDPHGFEWIDCNDHERSLVSFIRRGPDPNDVLLFVCNFTPVPRLDEPIGVPVGGRWTELLNSDATVYGGSGVGNRGGLCSDAVGHHGRPHRLRVSAPPLGVVVFRSPGGGVA